MPGRRAGWGGGGRGAVRANERAGGSASGARRRRSPGWGHAAGGARAHGGPGGGRDRAAIAADFFFPGWAGIRVPGSQTPPPAPPRPPARTCRYVSSGCAATHSAQQGARVDRSQKLSCASRGAAPACAGQWLKKRSQRMNSARSAAMAARAAAALGGAAEGWGRGLLLRRGLRARRGAGGRVGGSPSCGLGRRRAARALAAPGQRGGGAAAARIPSRAGPGPRAGRVWARRQHWSRPRGDPRGTAAPRRLAAPASACAHLWEVAAERARAKHSRGESGFHTRVIVKRGSSVASPELQCVLCRVRVRGQTEQRGHEPPLSPWRESSEIDCPRPHSRHGALPGAALVVASRDELPEKPTAQAIQLPPPRAVPALAPSVTQPFDRAPHHQAAAFFG